jgi:hypothetical protein
MHALHEYLCQQLEEMLKKRRVVVFYDPRREFEPFFDEELKESGTGYGGLPRVFVGERLTFVARYVDSFFALRGAVEPIADLDKPDPLIVYLPGVERDRQTSVLMELEKGGTTYEPQLKRLALNVLRKRFTDGQIDGMLRPASVTYRDIVSMLEQGGGDEPASVLRTIFDGAQSEPLLAIWLATAERDTTIAEKDATAELVTLVEARLGLAIPAKTQLKGLREKVARYLLVTEFRTDLECDPPQSVALVPEPSTKEHRERIHDVVTLLRRDHPDSYVALADQVQKDLALARAQLDAAHLGNVDTFRFEEGALLAHAGELIATRDYGGALRIAERRHVSFWVDRDVSRQAQWEACRLMAELGREVERVTRAVAGASSDPAEWVEGYVTEAGWFQVDALQRRLETWVAKMDEEPETQQALAVVRREHDKLLQRMAEGFTAAFRGSAWAVPGALHQTRIYPDVVYTTGGHVAYLLVDAMRYEMGVELAHQLEGTHDLTIRPAIAALPTITPVGMAALLPGASGSFSVVEHKGKVAARIEGSAMPGLMERARFLKAKVPDVVDLPLGKVLSATPGKLRTMLGEASLVVVRSQEIDALGENVDSLMARAAMEAAIGNVARAIRKLATAGIEHFVVTADHGHQFAVRKDDDMKTDNPGGQTLAIHRRCWVGHGGTTPLGTVRVSGAELGYDTNLEFVFPTGLGVFKSGGDLSYHHGSVSLQELVIPVLSFRIPAEEARERHGAVVELRGVPDAITNRTFGVGVVAVGDLFTTEPVAVTVVLVAGNEQVGRAGMVVGADFDRVSGRLMLSAGTEASVGMMLTRDDCESIRVVILDPATDAVLGQSDEIPVKLGI